jgi:phosphoenolpyruvate synthase/pyruvate phosphate dikinase
MDGLPVTIRLLDPPLHEFLPQEVRGREGEGQTEAAFLNNSTSTKCRGGRAQLVDVRSGSNELA